MNPFYVGMTLAGFSSLFGAVIGKSSEYILISTLAYFLFWGLDDRLPRK